MLDAVLESVMVFRLAAGAVTEVVVPLGLAKAGTYIVGSKAFGDSPCNGIFPRL